MRTTEASETERRWAELPGLSFECSCGALHHHRWRPRRNSTRPAVTTVIMNMLLYIQLKGFLIALRLCRFLCKWPLGWEHLQRGVRGGFGWGSSNISSEYKQRGTDKQTARERFMLTVCGHVGAQMAAFKWLQLPSIAAQWTLETLILMTLNLQA